MNINIAVVEDDENNTKQLVSHLNKYFGESTINPTIYTYDKAEDFISSLNTTLYDVVFMDIDLPNLDGISAAKLFRKQDAHAILVFVTNLAHLAIRGYEVNALDFVLKPVIYEDFKTKLRRIEKMLLKRKARTIPVEKYGTIQLVRADEIMYIEIISHTITFHLVNENIQQYGTLAALESKLSNFNFIRCNRCYLVNPMYIKKIDGQILTVGEDQITISRPRKAAFIEEFNNYLNNRGR